MKKRLIAVITLLFCLCFTFGLAGCTDNNTRTLTDAEKSIVGEWRMVGNNTLLTFSSDGTYKWGHSAGEFKQDSEGSDDIGHFIKFVIENRSDVFYLYDEHPDLLVRGQGGLGDGEPTTLDDSANYSRVIN